MGPPGTDARKHWHGPKKNNHLGFENYKLTIINFDVTGNPYVKS